ncbi:MAG: putative glycoside hydrolase [Acidobacteriota bacterium]
MSSGRIQFAATRYVGTQKVRDGAADAFRAYNPSFLVLHYQLGMGAGPASLIVCVPGGSDWGSDWPAIDANEAWFIHDDVGNRCLQQDWNWYLMDLQNPQWLDYWATRALERVACTHSDGVFADSTSDPWNMSTLPSWLQSDPYAFAPYVESFLAYAKGRFAGIAYNIPNAGPLVTTNSRIDYSDADGIMVEGFLGWDEQSPQVWPADWKLEMNRLMDLSRTGHIILCQTSVGSETNVAYRTYVLATYLLVKGAKTTLNLLPGDVDNFLPVWFPEWDLPVGSYASALPADVDQLFVAADGVYARDYTNALVLVNPDPAATRTITLGTTLYQPVISGGGVVDVNGNPSGSVAYQPVTSVTLPGRTGVVLIKNVTGPGGQDVILAPGPGPTNPPRIRGVDGSGVALPFDFNAYAVTRYGANVGSGAIDATPDAEILTAPGPGDVFGPQVRAFDRTGQPLAKVNFYAYGTLKFGARVTGGPLDADAFDEMATCPGPGAVFGPHVRGWGYDATQVAPLPGCSFFAFSTLKFGCYGTTADVEQGGWAEILPGAGPGAVFGSQVRGFRYTGASVQAMKLNFFAFAGSKYGARVSDGDVDADGSDEIAVGLGPSPANAQTVRLFDSDGTSVALLPGGEVTPFTGVAYGAVPGGSDVDGDGTAALLVGGGQDPAVASALRAYDYTGSALANIAALSVDLLGTTYGLNVAGADLGY